LADIDAVGVDHALCTGDVTQMSYAIEFERLSALYGPRLQQPERHTVIPGTTIATPTTPPGNDGSSERWEPWRPNVTRGSRPFHPRSS
jgi:hypothetical protein